MAEISLVGICATAFVSVFALLVVLAVVIRLIMAVFPEPAGSVDAAIVAAITATVATIMPGARVTDIREGS